MCVCCVAACNSSDSTRPTRAKGGEGGGENKSFACSGRLASPLPELPGFPSWNRGVCVCVCGTSVTPPFCAPLPFLQGGERGQRLGWGARPSARTLEPPSHAPAPLRHPTRQLSRWPSSLCKSPRERASERARSSRWEKAFGGIHGARTHVTPFFGGASDPFIATTQELWRQTGRPWPRPRPGGIVGVGCQEVGEGGRVSGCLRTSEWLVGGLRLSSLSEDGPPPPGVVSRLLPSRTSTSPPPPRQPPSRGACVCARAFTRSVPCASLQNRNKETHQK